jgi:hypothetical protein
MPTATGPPKRLGKNSRETSAGIGPGSKVKYQVSTAARGEARMKAHPIATVARLVMASLTSMGTSDHST